MNDMNVAVTPNLWTAMDYFRKQKYLADMLIWVDTLCINQTDTAEKNSQIPRMRLIYQRADLVNVWLGPEANNSSLAMRLINEYSWSLVTMKTYSPDKTRKELGKQFISWALSDVTHSESLRALAALYRRSYWTRVWIIQELLSNPGVLIHCGNEGVLLKPILALGDDICDMCADSAEYLDRESPDYSVLTQTANDLYTSCRWTPHLLRDKEIYLDKT